MTPGTERRTLTDATMAAPATPDAVGVRYLGHATVLLELPGVRILTDPFLRDRLGPLRRHGPTPDPDALGRIDVIAISHAHPDHLDPESLRLLAGDPLVIVPTGLGAAIRRIGLRVREVDVGEPATVAPGATITSVPARHWRWPRSPRAGAVGYLIEGDHEGIYFAGDTAPYRAMRAFADRVDIALLPVATWGPHRGPGHLSPRTAAEVARDLDARVAVPIHWGTLYPVRLERLLGDRLSEPANRFAWWAGRKAPDLDVQILRPGEGTRIERQARRSLEPRPIANHDSTAPMTKPAPATPKRTASP
jgi:L-ascorbate metabolism protein UlaG (beta-lactamase superfamily)